MTGSRDQIFSLLSASPNEDLHLKLLPEHCYRSVHILFRFAIESF